MKPLVSLLSHARMTSFIAMVEISAEVLDPLTAAAGPGTIPARGHKILTGGKNCFWSTRETQSLFSAASVHGIASTPSKRRVAGICRRVLKIVAGVQSAM
jgi:hypothetical protein